MRSSRRIELERRKKQSAARRKLLVIYGKEGLEVKLREFLAQEREQLKTRNRKFLNIHHPTKSKKATPITAKEVVRASVTLAEKRGNAERMIKNPTPAEARLWEYLKDDRMGVTFQRQILIQGWIADFYSPDVKVVIEVDGAYHALRRDEDKLRAQVMFRAAGIFTMRFDNAEVFNASEAMLAAINRVILIGKSLPRKKGWKHVSKELLASL